MENIEFKDLKQGDIIRLYAGSFGELSEKFKNKYLDVLVCDANSNELVIYEDGELYTLKNYCPANVNSRADFYCVFRPNENSIIYSRELQMSKLQFDLKQLKSEVYKGVDEAVEKLYALLGDLPFSIWSKVNVNDNVLSINEVQNMAIENIKDQGLEYVIDNFHVKDQFEYYTMNSDGEVNSLSEKELIKIIESVIEELEDLKSVSHRIEKAYNVNELESD